MDAQEPPPGVEFLDEPPAHGGADVGRRPRRRPAGVVVVLAFLVGALVAGVAIAVTADVSSRPARHRRIALPHSASPSSTPPNTGIRWRVSSGTIAGTPSVGVAAAFAAAVPGALTTDEQTLTGRHDGTTVVVRRVVRAVSGNVSILLVVSRASPGAGVARAPRRFTSHGYVFDFTFFGYYAPTHEQLTRLVADRRLTAA